MSTPANSDPRIDQAAVTDESLLAVHEKALGRQPDEKAHYRLMPLVLLFLFSGLIFFGGTYLGRYSGHFDSKIFDENVHKGAATAAEPVKQLSPEEVIALGKKLYNDAACNSCHQPTGLGTPPAIPPLAGSEWVTGSEERLIRIVVYGLNGKVTVKGATYEGEMPSFGRGVPATMKNWSDDRIAAVLTYVRQEWGNQAGPITTEKVAEIRAKEGTHPKWTAEQLQALP